MRDLEIPTHDLGQAATMVLQNARRMAERGDSAMLLNEYLSKCWTCFLEATRKLDSSTSSILVEDLARAIRHALPNAELLGALVVFSTVMRSDPEEVACDFRFFSSTVGQRLRAEIRDHARLGVCDVSDIRLGAEIALQSLQPLLAA